MWIEPWSVALEQIVAALASSMLVHGRSSTVVEVIASARILHIDTIVDEDVLSDLIVIDWVHLLSIKALMHMTELVATCIVAHWIARDRVVWRLLSVISRVLVLLHI